uniref:Putative secreted protein n=1 Tax=Ixodes ricinus TaxID=34613 RepID=A0A6B0U309_IXORI
MVLNCELFSVRRQWQYSVALLLTILMCGATAKHFLHFSWGTLRRAGDSTGKLGYSAAEQTLLRSIAAIGKRKV